MLHDTATSTADGLLILKRVRPSRPTIFAPKIVIHETGQCVGPEDRPIVLHAQYGPLVAAGDDIGIPILVSCPHLGDSISRVEADQAGGLRGNGSVH